MCNKNNSLIAIFFFLSFFSVAVQMQGIGYGRLAVDCISSNIEPVYRYVTDENEEKKYNAATKDGFTPLMEAVLWHVKNAQLPLMQLATGAVASTLFSPQKLFPMPMSDMYYWAVYALYTQMQKVDAWIFKKNNQRRNQSVEDKILNYDVGESMTSLQAIGGNVLLFVGVAGLNYFAQSACPILFETIEPMGLGSVLLPDTWMGKSGLDVVDQAVRFSQAKQLVLLTAIVLAVLRLKPKNGDYFYFKNIWVYIGLDLTKCILDYAYDAYDGNVKKNSVSSQKKSKISDQNKIKAGLLAGCYLCTAMPMMVTVGHTLLSR